MPTATAVTQKDTLRELQRLAKEHEKFIGKVKEEVAKEYDNTNNPTPLFQQLRPSG